MTTVPYPFPYPSAATYPPPLLSGGYYPSPFPYASSSYPSPPAPGFFPAPAHGPSTFVPLPPAPPPAYPYPPPASAYTAASGFSPTPACGSPPDFFYAATYSYPPPASAYMATTGPSPVPAYVPSTLPSTIHLPYSQLLASSPESTASPATQTPLHAPSPPESTSPATPTPPAIGALANSATPATALLCCRDQAPGAPLTDSLRFSPPPPAGTPATALLRRQVHGAPIPNDAFHTSASRMQPDRAPMALSDHTLLLKLQNSKVEAVQRYGCTVVPKCHGGELTTGSNTSGASMYGEQIVHKHTGPEILSMNNTGSNHKVVTHQAQLQSSFDSPHGAISKLSTLFSDFTVSRGLQTNESLATESSLVAADAPSTSPATTSYVAPQVFGKMPQQYDFHNLSRKTVFLADGSEHSYYALPADYPLELATQPLSSSAAEIVSVRAPPSVAAQAAGLAPVCYSKTNNTTGSETMLVRDVQPPTAMQDDHKVLNEVHVFDISKDEKQESGQFCKCLSRPSDNPLPEVISEFTLTDNVDVFVPRSIKFKHGQCIPQVLEYAYTPGCAMGDVLLKDNKWNILLSEEGREVWDPGASTSLYSSKDKPPEELSYVAIMFTKTLNLCNQVGTYVQQLRDPSWNGLVNYDRRKEWDPGDNTIWSPTLNTDSVGALQTSVLALPCVLTVRVHFGAPTCVPSKQETYGIQSVWDPGILRWNNFPTHHINRDSSMKKGSIFSMDSGLSNTTVPKLMDLKHFWAQLYHSGCTNLNACLQLQYCCLPSVLDCLYSESIKKQVCYSIKFSSTAMCMSTTTVRMRLVFSSEKIAQEEKDAAARYQVLKIQVQMSKTSRIWDPGIDSLLCVCMLHVHMIQQVGCSAIHACHLVSAFLPPMQIAAYCPSNIKQGTQKNYNAKNLLSSPNYLQILELNIIFITFRPP